jgi:hypothetical protein
MTVALVGMRPSKGFRAEVNVSAILRLNTLENFLLRPLVAGFCSILASLN